MNKKNTMLRQMVAATLTALGVFGTAVSDAGTTTSFTYDAVGQVTSVTSPSGRTKSLQWDAFGRNVSQTVNGASTGYGYNYQNALTAVQDPKGLTTSYDRNGFGEARSLTSPDTGTSNYSYDANGNPTSRVNAAGQVESYTYDAADRVVTKTVSHPAGGSLTYTFSYGTSGVEAGRLVQIAAPGLMLSYTHNILGAVTSASQAIPGSPTLTTSYGYAANGALTSITYPSGRVVSMGLDSASRPSSMTSGGTNLLTGIGYTPLGAVAGWTFGSGQAVVRSFDGAGRVASVTMPWGARTYSYDNEDRIVGITDGALGSATYGYDGFDRLTSATTALGAWAYGYDANGNRTSNSVNGLGYGVAVDGSSNRVNGYINQAGYARVVDYTPDGHAAQVGSGTPQPSCGSSVTFGYQADGQLATSNVFTAIHAPNGLRLQKTAAACAGGAKTNFIYDLAGHLIGEYDATGAPIQETAWLGDLPVAVFKALGGVVSNFNVYADNLGTPRVITSTSGQVVWGWDGEPFGATPANQNPNNLGDFTYGLRFPGQYFDVETGYHHNGWREYEPALGRYVQSDPIGLAGGLNTYVYVGGNPLNGIDPLGLDTITVYLYGTGYGHAGISINGSPSMGFYGGENIHLALASAGALSALNLQSGVYLDSEMQPKKDKVPVDKAELTVTPEQANAAVKKLKEIAMKRPSYHLYANNCAQVAAEVVRAAGVEVPWVFMPSTLVSTLKKKNENTTNH
jgi:RHS repeat-associated protein